MFFPTFVLEAFSSIIKLLVVCTSSEAVCDVNTLCVSPCVMLPVNFGSTLRLGENLYIYKGDVLKCVSTCVPNGNVPKTQRYVRVIMVPADGCKCVGECYL